MKKILLTLIAGFCFGSIAMAQAPAKLAKKKNPTVPLASSPNLPAAPNPEKVAQKNAILKAIEAGKAVPVVSKTNDSKISVVAEKAN